MRITINTQNEVTNCEIREKHSEKQLSMDRSHGFADI